jgi:hypothetical protein
MDKFWELLGQSTIFQGVLMLSVVGIYIFMLASSKPVPEGLDKLVYMVVAFFFGGKYQAAVNTATRNAQARQASISE